MQFAAPSGQKEVVELLIAEGADVNAKMDNGRTALHWAALMGHKEVAELLIANGAVVKAKENDGSTHNGFWLMEFLTKRAG